MKRRDFLKLASASAIGAIVPLPEPCKTVASDCASGKSSTAYVWVKFVCTATGSSVAATVTYIGWGVQG